MEAIGQFYGKPGIPASPLEQNRGRHISQGSLQDFVRERLVSDKLTKEGPVVLSQEQFVVAVHDGILQSVGLSVQITKYPFHEEPG